MLPGYSSQRNAGLAWQGKERSSYLAKSFCLGNENKHMFLIIIRMVICFWTTEKIFFFHPKIAKPQNSTFFYFALFALKQLMKDWDSIWFFFFFYLQEGVMDGMKLIDAGEAESCWRGTELQRHSEWNTSKRAYSYHMYRNTRGTEDLEVPTDALA